MTDSIYIAVVTDGLSQPEAETFSVALEAVRWALDRTYGYTVRVPLAESGALRSLSADGEWGVADGTGRAGYVYRRHIRSREVEPAGVAEDVPAYVATTEDDHKARLVLDALAADPRTGFERWYAQPSLLDASVTVECAAVVGERTLAAAQRVAREVLAGAGVPVALF